MYILICCVIKNSIINSPEYYYSMRLRKIWCEGNFSHQKENHNLRRTRKRGIERVTEQCLLSACALNLKRMVKLLKGRLLQTIYSMFFSLEDFRAVFFLRNLVGLSTGPKQGVISKGVGSNHPLGGKELYPERKGYDRRTLDSVTRGPKKGYPET